MRLFVGSFAAILLSASTPAGALVPTAYLTAGGGFKTMTESMGVMRALYEEGLLPAFTHFGCCSETYSDYSVQESVGGWGDTYVPAMEQAVENAELQSLEFRLDAGSFLCPLEYLQQIKEVINAAVNLVLEDLLFPATNWFNYVSSFLEPYITEVTTQSFAASRQGHPDGTIVHAISLAPDIFSNDASDQPKLVGQTPGVNLLPISFSAPAGEEGVWGFPKTDEKSLEVSLGNFNPEVVPLDLSPGASIAEVSAATSSALGLFGSPTLFDLLIADVLDRSNFSAAEQATLEGVLDSCAPLGLENMSSPTEGNVPSSTTSWSPKYRYMDGGFTECSGLTHTIARMQFDCVNSTEFDCDDGIRAVELFGSAAGEFQTIPRLFANCDCGTTNYEYLGESINSQIFEEDFNSDVNSPGWTLYSNVTYPNTTEPSLSYAWRGVVTTIDNPGYRVTAGTKVELVVLFIADPGNPEVETGVGASFGFETVYGQVAQEQYDAVLAFLQSEELAESWLGETGPSGKKAKSDANGKKSKESKSKESKKGKSEPDDASGKKSKAAKEMSKIGKKFLKN